MTRPKNCVILVTPPADWRPQRFHSVPPSIESARIYCKNLKLPEAVAAAKAFNKAHLSNADYRGEWAVAVKWLRPNKSGRPSSERKVVDRD